MTTLRPESIAPGLPELPAQPAGTPWPTVQWARNEPAPSDPERFRRLCDGLFDLPAGSGVTYALLIVKRGELVYERYAAGANAMYLQYSWSMAKSVTQALVGILLRQGRLDLYAPAPVPEWQSPGDSRRAITLDHLLRMRSGLEFREDYVDGEGSDVIPMLSFDGRHDTGAFAAAKPLLHAPGSTFSYASGTTNIICRILRDLVGGGASGMLRFMNDELFEPLGMRTPTPKFDTSGTFIGSSFLFATPQDFARFGYLYLRDGVWDGRRILPEGWVDYARSCSYADDTQAYGAHWWLLPHNHRWFCASGYDGQRILIAPDRDLVIVRLGRTDVDHIAPVWDAVNALAEQL
ncbi:MAG: serine hydrolase [Pseudomonadales bacterium]